MQIITQNLWSILLFHFSKIPWCCFSNFHSFFMYILVQLQKSFRTFDFKRFLKKSKQKLEVSSSQIWNVYIKLLCFLCDPRHIHCDVSVDSGSPRLSAIVPPARDTWKLQEVTCRSCNNAQDGHVYIYELNVGNQFDI